MSKGIRFVGVGIINTLSYFVISWFLIVIFGTDARVTNVVAYVAAMGLSYLGHRHITFKSRAGKVREVSKFVVVNAINLILSTLLLMYVVDTLGVNRFLATLLAGILIMCSSFVIMQIWVFRDRGSRARPDT